MSDNIVKIIPQDPYDKIPESTLLKAQIFLEGEIQCDFIETKNSEIPMFIDCGSNFEKILCPVCGKELNFKWWGETETMKIMICWRSCRWRKGMAERFSISKRM